MSKIENLINELCPNGVEMVKLGEVMTIQRGASPRPIKDYMSDSEHGTPWIKIGDVSPEDKYITYTKEYITNDGVKKSRLLKAGDFILSNSMSFGRPYILQIDGCIHDGWISMSNFENAILPGYLYQILRSNSTQGYWKMKANDGGAMTNLNADIVRDTIIPLPPLPIQEEIVRILDKFTAMQENLDKELELRQKQYEYYREKLLTFEDSVEKVSFGNTFQLKARIGWQGLTKKEYRDSGEYKLVTGTDFTENHTIDFSTCVYVDKERYDQDEYIQLKKDDVLITKDGTLGKVAYISSLEFPTTLNGGVFVVRDLSGRINQRFTMHYLCSYNFKSWMEKNHTSGSIQHLTQKLLVNFMIPVPPFPRQQEIVAILDKFEAMIANLKEEKTLRQKQYEYYREKLLTFN